MPFCVRAESCYLGKLQMSTNIFLQNDCQYSISTKNNVIIPYKDIFHYYINLYLYMNLIYLSILLKSLLDT